MPSPPIAVERFAEAVTFDPIAVDLSPEAVAPTPIDVENWPEAIVCTPIAFEEDPDAVPPITAIELSPDATELLPKAVACHPEAVVLRPAAKAFGAVAPRVLDASSWVLKSVLFAPISPKLFGSLPMSLKPVFPFSVICSNPNEPPKVCATPFIFKSPVKLISPLTSNLELGFVVLIPTLPPSAILIFSESTVKKPILLLLTCLIYGSCIPPLHKISLPLFPVVISPPEIKSPVKLPVPLTSNLELGFVVPIPTLPELLKILFPDSVQSLSAGLLPALLAYNA